MRTVRRLERRLSFHRLLGPVLVAYAQYRHVLEPSPFAQGIAQDSFSFHSNLLQHPARRVSTGAIENTTVPSESRTFHTSPLRITGAFSFLQVVVIGDNVVFAFTTLWALAFVRQLRPRSFLILGYAQRQFHESAPVFETCALR